MKCFCCDDSPRMLSALSGQLWNSWCFSFVYVHELDRSFFQQEKIRMFLWYATCFRFLLAIAQSLVFFNYIQTWGDWRAFLLSEKSLPGFPDILWSLDMCLQLILPWAKHSSKYFQWLKPDWVITIIHSDCHNTSRRSLPSCCFCPKHIFKGITS